jgi:hypothetical protein
LDRPAHSHPPRPPSTSRHDHLGFSTSARNCRVLRSATEMLSPSPNTGVAASQASERTKSPDDDLRSLCSFARNSPTPGNGAESPLRRGQCSASKASKRAKVIGGFVRFARFARNVISIGVSTVIQKGGGCILGCPPKFSIENHGREAGFVVPEREDKGDIAGGQRGHCYIWA